MTETITPIRFERVLKSIGKALPLKHRLYPLVRRYSKRGGLLSVSWGKARVVFPGDWPVFVVTGLIFEGQTLNPEFILLKDILRNLRPGAIVDIGANIGCYVLEIRQHTSAPIIAYEPAPQVFRLLKKNVETNKLEAVEVKNVACGDAVGSILLDLSINSTISQSEFTAETAGAKASVEVTTLDDDLKSLPQVALLKIDCEGFEFHVLAGAKEVLKKHRPVLLIELHPKYIGRYGKRPVDVCETLRDEYDLEFYDFDIARRGSRARRFISRYRLNKGHRFSTENEMLSEIQREPVPAQIFIVAYPKKLTTPP